jgi:hypothetical protein
MLIAMPHKAHLVAAIDPDKGTILDIRKKHIVRTVPKWSGGCTKDGRFGLYAPSRSGHRSFYFVHHLMRFDEVRVRNGKKCVTLNIGINMHWAYNFYLLLFFNNRTMKIMETPTSTV